MKNIKYLSFLLILFFLPTLVNAYTKLGASTQGPIVGKEVYVFIDLDYGNNLIQETHLKVTYDPSALEITDSIQWTQGRSSNGTYRLEPGAIYIDKTSASDNWKTGTVFMVKFIVLKKGETVLRITREGDAYYSDGNIIPYENSSSITIYGKEANSNTDLKSLVVEGYRLNPVFSTYKREYNLDVPADVSSINITTQRADSTQVIEGDGNRELKFGDNTIEIKVIAQNGDSSVYTIKVHRDDKRTGDTSLKEISVSNSDLTYEKDKTIYETTVSRSVDNVIISARATDSNATLLGTGRKQLEFGRNEFKLSVKSPNGVETEYTVIVNRSTEEFQVINQSSRLLSLKANGIVFDLNDNKSNFLFSVDSNTDKLDLTTVAESKTAKIEVTGNEELKEGINKIEIKVTEIDESENIYTIIVYKNPNAERVKDIKTADFYSTSIVEYTTPTLIPKEAIDKINNNNVTLYYNIVNMYSGLLYQVKLSKNLTSEFTPSIKRVEGDSNLKYESNIPEGNEIVLYLDGAYQDGNDVKITSTDSTGKNSVITEGVRVDNGYVRFTSSGASYYTFTASTPVANKMSIFDYINQYKTIIVVVLIAGAVILLLTSAKKKPKPEPKEPLY